MKEEKSTSLPPACPANPDGQDLPPAAPEATGTRLDRLETLLLERMAGIASSINELRGGEATPSDLADRYRNLSARLSLLEENFARICNVLGRLDQEFQALKSAAERNER